MMKMKGKSIKIKIMLGFGFFALLTASIFSLFNFFVAYTVEDEFFARIIKDEANYIVKQHQDGEFDAVARFPFLTVYSAIDELPQEVSLLYYEEPRRREFAGAEGRHYHLHIAENAPNIIILAEVSDYLVVRPRTSGILQFLSVSTVIMLISAALFGYWMAARTTRPLTNLADLVANTAPSSLPKDFAQHFPRNEIGVLADSLEHTLSRISDFIEREQHFTRDASHELRTPITVIKGASELLQTEQLSLRGKSLVNRIQHATISMEQVVATLRALAREPEANSSKANTILLPLIEETVLEFAHLLNEKDVNVAVNVPQNLFTEVPAPAIKIIIANLISNAFQYTHSGNVTIRYDGKALSIEDSGVGSKSFNEDSWNTLTKGTNSSGFGIGLSIVKRLCEKYSLELSSLTSTAGTIIRITF
jgi:signal transduction histidine kinase